MSRYLTILALLIATALFYSKAYAVEQVSSEGVSTEQTNANEESNTAIVDNLDEALYSPFIERYVLDELKQLRIDQANTRTELIQQIVDREHRSVDRGVDYATSTITYFFYLIAAASSVLVVVGWTSIREMKERVHSLADEEISRLITEYEVRLETMESLMKQKTRHIEENREEIELTQELQSHWLRAQQEPSAANKIAIYDEILKLKPTDCEALTYKADAVLELNEPQWAANLCRQALKIDKDNSHAFYQLACAYTAMNQMEEAVRYLKEALHRRDSYLVDIRSDLALQPLVEHELFKELVESLETSHNNS
jgi:tetratricopeptide (TPR) repeat protein